MTIIEPFVLHGDLPVGRLAIEASAGTGKTYALSSLAARYIAERGVAIDELLIVTFTRAAAAELKDRVRSRLVECAAWLDLDALPDELQSDEFVSTIWSDDAATRHLRASRVRTALTTFDSSTITTIHGFAQQILGTMGTAATTDPDAVLLDNSKSLIAQVATDLLVVEALEAGDGDTTAPDLETLRTATSLALGNPEARLVPDARSTDVPATARRLSELVYTAQAEVGRRSRLAATQSFDDLLVRLREAIDDPEFGVAARETIQRRYRVALIDEFQDTDPVQWSVFDAVFGQTASGDAPATTLVLVGDPKQAIYAFRGANVHTYLQAVRTADTERRILGINWRSDPAVLSATEQLLAGATFGDVDIGFQPVGSPEAHRGRRFASTSGDDLPALSIRLFDNADVPRKRNGSEALATAAAAVYDEMATYLRDLLEHASIPDDDEPGGSRPLRPSDIAVLMGANREGPLIRAALGRLDIPAVIARGDNVLESEAASHWHRLLAAIARPTDPARVRAAALTWFGGKDTAWITGASEIELLQFHEQIHGWAEHLNMHGVASFVGRVRSESRLIAQVLSLHDGDRAMTDIGHIAELLVLSAGARQSPATLLALYEQLSSGNDSGDPETDQAARRVESEASAVQIMTTFVAKGLEFPVVCCPSLSQSAEKRSSPNIWWDRAAETRVVDLASKIEWGPDGARGEQRKNASVAELVGANLRVLYVALTRARHHTAVWWLPTAAARDTGLARVLFARTEDGTIDAAAYAATKVDVPFGDDAVAALQPLVDNSDGTLEVRLVGPPIGDRRPWTGTATPQDVPLGVASLGRGLPRDSARWSFTSITAHGGTHGERSIDPTDPTLGDSRSSDESQTFDPATGPAEAGAKPPNHIDIPLPLGDIAGGAGFGNLVHQVLEEADFTAADLEAELTEAVDASLRWNPWDVDPARLVDGLVAVLNTPLGPLFDGLSLRELDRTDRLDELSFDLTLGRAGPAASDADIGVVLLDHLAQDDPMRKWAEHLAGGPFGTRLAGHLTGSIDLVARIRGIDEPDRFVVCDYKSNRLASSAELPTSRHFEPAHLALAMAEADYALQALLYSVALHRYLRWRISGYDPTIHLGGVGYMFVRGMIGPDTPVHAGAPNGLFEWHPPSGLIVALSDLLDGTPNDASAAK